jgi:hypothetical protein
LPRNCIVPSTIGGQGSLFVGNCVGPLQPVLGVPEQIPPEHRSLLVQARPSSQAVVVLLVTQPIAGSQASRMQGLPALALHTRAEPARQLPPEHASPIVQALPSLQAAVVLLVTQPIAGSQASRMQGLPALALHTSAVPSQAPPRHASALVQALPSSQAALLFTWLQASFWQSSVVHGFWSSQSAAALQAQVAVSETHERALSEQLSVVQARPSSQTRATPKH